MVANHANLFIHVVFILVHDGYKMVLIMVLIMVNDV